MIYFDNAATSFPKPPQVAQRMQEYVASIGATINRSTYGAAQAAGMTALRLRQQLCELFHTNDPAHVVLTAGNTMSINMVLRGYLKPGMHCLVSSMEHNAVMRPLQDLQAQGVCVERVPCDAEGRMNPSDILPRIRQNTKLFVLAHGSNVSGTVQNAEEIGDICEKNGIAFCLDAAQTAGHIPIDFCALRLSALCVPGHKGLLGPSGIGALLLAPDFAKALCPIISGGTGSASDSERQPEYMPDRFESGTPNIPGIYGLSAALDFLLQYDVASIAAHDRTLCTQLLSGLREMKRIRVVGPPTTTNRVGVVSVDFLGIDNAEAADRLEREFGILTRCGLHCAPAAHKTLGTFPQGTVRFSLGLYHTHEDIEAALAAIQKVSEG